jgi:methionine-rich copper-binding protein CopC
MMADRTQPRTTVEDTGMSIRRAAAALLLSGAAVVATATPALAHTELDRSSPAEGATLAAPKLIVLSFTGHVTLPANPITVTVTGGNGASWTVGKATATGPVVTAPVRPSGPPGPCTLTYKVIAEDGDAVTGTISFTIVPADTTSGAPPPTATTTPPSTASSTAAHGAPAPHGVSGAVSDAASTSDSGGPPAWVWILGAVVVLAIGVLVAFRLGRSSGPEILAPPPTEST